MIVKIESEDIESVDVDKLIKVQDKLRELHFSYAVKQQDVDTFSELISPWSLLIDLIQYFILEYRSSGTVKFKVWHFRKNFVLIVKVIRFFVSLHNHFFPEEKVEGNNYETNTTAFNIDARYV